MFTEQKKQLIDQNSVEWWTVILFLFSDTCVLFNKWSLLQEMLAEEEVCEPAAMDSEDVLFLLYTSGSTGKPKGLVHTQAGYLLYAALTHRVNTKHSLGVLFILSQCVFPLRSPHYCPP